MAQDTLVVVTYKDGDKLLICTEVYPKNGEPYVLSVEEVCRSSKFVA